MKRSLFLSVQTGPDDHTQLHLDRRETGLSIAVGDLLDVEGRQGVSKIGEPTMFVETVLSHRRGRAVPAVAPSLVLGIEDAELLGRVRTELSSRGYREMLTPVSLSAYNGGTSTPMHAAHGDKRVGFLRVTFEEQMLTAVAMLLAPVYQVGSIFKGGLEITLVEGYRPATSLAVAEAETLAVIQAAAPGVGEPARVDFGEALREIHGPNAEKVWRAIQVGDGGELRAVGLDVPVPCSPLRALGTVTSRVAAELNASFLTLVGLPAATSPLYRSEEGPFGHRNQQGKVLLHGRLVGDFGVQETDPGVLDDRLNRQAASIGRGGGADDGPSRAVHDAVRLGVPDCVGYSVRLGALIVR